MREEQAVAHRSGSYLPASLLGHDDSRLAAALGAYVEALESGQAPDRCAILARYPDLAERLVQCFDGLDLVRCAASGFETQSYHPARRLAMPSMLEGCVLGDYRVLGEVGRGGMGVVYEAVQVSLGRRVALKVLPASLAADPKLLQRFRVEAQAAAQLHHTHIVPVFSVGCAEGIHYYAMQFIDGPTLADVIGDLRVRGAQATDESRLTGSHAEGSDTGSTRVRGGSHEDSANVSGRVAKFGMHCTTLNDGMILEFGKARVRTVARYAVQAARALEHAHGLGVVHRDIKPANLMLDSRGHLWVTDFGLARIQEDTGLTVTGDLLGTLRYMSPEQVSGRRAVIDHRADLYALGTTLYELLTLRPAVQGRDRQELIREICEQDPERPRRIDATIPRELETIVMKAMAKEPYERYQSAAEMADDLQRFLDDKPILARPPTVIDHATKWARRHRSLVLSGSLALLLVSVFLGISTLQLASERDRIEAQRARVASRYQVARAVIDNMYMAIVEKWLALEPEKAALQQEFLMKALQYYDAFAREPGDGARGLRDAALAHRRMGDIHYRLGRPDEAERAYRRGLAILESLESSNEASALQVAEHAALLCKHLGQLMQATIRDAEAEGMLRRAVGYQERAEQLHPEGGGFSPLAELCLELGLSMARNGKREQALTLLNRAVALTSGVAARPDLNPRERQLLDASMRSIRSHIHEAHGRVDSAVAEARAAVDLYRELIEGMPERPDVRARFTNAAFRLSWLISTVDDPSLRDPDEAIRLARATIELEPHNAKFHDRLAVLLMANNDLVGAEAAFRKVLSLTPASPNASNSLAWILARRDDADRTALSEALELAEQAVRESPETGIFWNTLGVVQYRLGNYRDAVIALRRSMNLRSGGDAYDWFFMAMAQWRLGFEVDAIGWVTRAVRWRELKQPGNVELKQFQNQASRVLAEANIPTLGVLPQPSLGERKVARQRAKPESGTTQAATRREPLPVQGASWSLSAAAGAAVVALALRSLLGDVLDAQSSGRDLSGPVITRAADGRALPERARRQTTPRPSSPRDASPLRRTSKLPVLD